MKENILLVEDDPAILRLWEAVVRITDFQYETAKTGTEAVAALKKGRYNLVVTDENLPGVKGHEIAEWMRESDVYRDTPVILISAEQNSRLFSDLTARGVITLFIPKPSNINQLKASIQTVLSLKLVPKSFSGNGSNQRI